MNFCKAAAKQFFLGLVSSKEVLREMLALGIQLKWFGLPLSHVYDAGAEKSNDEFRWLSKQRQTQFEGKRSCRCRKGITRIGKTIVEVVRRRFVRVIFCAELTG